MEKLSELKAVHDEYYYCDNSSATKDDMEKARPSLSKSTTCIHKPSQNLYSDALKRMKHKQIVEFHYEQCLKQIAEMPKSNLVSGRLAKGKLEKDLKKILAEVNPTKEGTLTFDMLGKFMNRIGVYQILYNPDYHVFCRPDGEFIYRNEYNNLKFYERKDNELEFHVNIWRILKRSHKGYIDAELLLELILLLSDFSSETIKDLAVHAEELFKVADNGYGATNTEMKWTCEKLIKAYKRLHCGPLIISSQKRRNTDEFRFNPIINEKSRKMANRTMSTYVLTRNQSLTSINTTMPTTSTFDARVMMMYDKWRETGEKWQRLREEKEREELEGCTFRPTVRRYRCSSSRKPKRRCKTSEERELEQCTFSPKLHTRNFVRKEQSTPKGYEETVKRMRKAEKENRERSMERERISSGENYEKVRNMKMQPPRMCYRKLIERQPLLRVEVNVSAHRKGTIVIHKGEDLEKVINNFARTFQLKTEKVEELYAQLKKHTENILSPTCKPYSLQ